MEQNKFSNDLPEEVILNPKPRIIRIVPSQAQRAYGLFDSKTGTQVTDFVKGNGEEIEFRDLNPGMHYDVGVIGNPGDKKPQFAIIWSAQMQDNTEEILKNSNDLPIEYPETYKVIFNDNNLSGTYDLVDDKGETVGQVVQLTQGDKPEFWYVRTLRIKNN